MPECQPAVPLQPAIVDVSVIGRTGEPPILGAVRRELAARGRSAEVAVAAVTIGRAGALSCLLLDLEWLQLAEQTKAVRPVLIDDLAIPSAAIIAVLDDAWDNWSERAAENVSWSIRGDGVLLASTSRQLEPRRQDHHPGHDRP